MHFGGKGWSQSCIVCRNPKHPRQRELRAEWGCDAPTDSPQFSMRCPFCKGLDDTCTECDGQGEIDVHRCPFSLLQPVHHDVCHAAGMAECGVLPMEGGWYQQSATFIDALHIVSGELARYREKKNKPSG